MKKITVTLAILFILSLAIIFSQRGFEKRAIGKDAVKITCGNQYDAVGNKLAISDCDFSSSELPWWEKFDVKIDTDYGTYTFKNKNLGKTPMVIDLLSVRHRFIHYAFSYFSSRSVLL